MRPAHEPSAPTPKVLLAALVASVALAVLTATAASALPELADAYPERDRQRDVLGRYMMADTVTPLLFGDSGSGGPAKARADTFFLLGGPDSWDGRFETPGGQPDWHGWTHLDKNAPQGDRWRISTYFAENLNDNGPGNHAMWCGEDFPSCGPDDPDGGYGDNYRERLVWKHPATDPAQPTTVAISAWLNIDLTDATWDFLYYEVWLGDGWHRVETWTGSFDNIHFQHEHVVQPGQYAGENNDEIWLRWFVETDWGWSDADCESPSHGAFQIDDINVHLDGLLATFDDFEPGSEVHWEPEPFLGVGDFTQLRSNLQDLDPCRSNASWQVNFVDDGVVVPGTGGTPCISWCYGPDGWIVNNTGGLAGSDPQIFFIENLVISPPLAWPSGTDAGRLDFDVYVHEELGHQTIWPGMFYMWQVRSTASEDPADLELAAWRSRNFVFYGGPVYRRHQEAIGDLLVDGSRWVQVGLEVNEMGWVWGWHGNNGTPAPYFDNVAVRAWAPDGPQIIMDPSDLFQDAFPEQGVVDPENPASNWCRIDSSRRASPNSQPFVARDAIRIQVKPHRRHAQVVEAPRLHWIQRCNPLFDDVRPEAPGPDGILRGMVAAELTGATDTWWVDLPDSNFFYPGDVLRYYITATEVVAGDPDYQGLSVWPPDTTAVTDFTLGSPYTRLAEIRALPSLDGDWQQPAVLLWESTTGDELRRRWLSALAELGLEPGVDVDIYTNRRPGSDIGQRLGGRCTLDQLDRYAALIIAADDTRNRSIGNANTSNPDEPLLMGWLDRGGKKVLAVGGDLVSGSRQGSNILPVVNRLGAGTLISIDLFALSAPPRDMQVVAQLGGEVLPTDGVWPLASGCPDPARIDVLTPVSDAWTAANFADPDGPDLGYPAVIARVEDALANRYLLLPFALAKIEDESDRDATPSTRTALIGDLLAWLGVIDGPPTSVPTVRSLRLAAYPNPFNPRTVFAYELPRADRVSLAVYDLRGKLVRRVVDEHQAAGRHEVAWDGRDGAGRNVASGSYFYRFSAGREQRGGKLTLLK